MKSTKKTFKNIIFVYIIFVIQLFSRPAFACIEGMTWGMDLSSVENHLGVMLNPIKNTQKEDLYEVKDFKMSDLPVLSLKLRIKNEEGLKQIAYEIDYENMTEVLAGLRNRFGSPIGTSEIVDGNEPQQQWIWHTGVDVITAIKSDKRPFILSYKPSLLDPSFLG